VETVSEMVVPIYRALRGSQIQ